MKGHQLSCKQIFEGIAAVQVQAPELETPSSFQSPNHLSQKAKRSTHTLPPTPASDEISMCIHKYAVRMETHHLVVS